MSEVIEDSYASDNEVDEFNFNMSGVLKGNIQMDISHEGGEFLQVLFGETDTDPKEHQQKYQDHWTCHDHLE